MKVKGIGDCPLVFVEWIDSCGITTWKPVELLVKEEPCCCFTLGFLLAEGQGRKIIAQTVCDPHEDHSGPASGDQTMVIPESAIISVRKIILDAGETLCSSAALADVQAMGLRK